MPTPKEPVFPQLQAIIASTLDTRASAVALDAQLRDDLGADSLDLIELSIALEEKFLPKRNIPMADLDSFRTVGDVVAYIEKNAA